MGEIIREYLEHIYLIIHNFFMVGWIPPLSSPHGINVRLLYTLIGINLVITSFCALAAWMLMQIQPSMAQWSIQIHTLEATFKTSLSQTTHAMLQHRQTLQTRHDSAYQANNRLQTYFRYLQWSRSLLIILQRHKFRERESGKLSL